jgi:tRNA 2-thiouridine synthesizing protein A
MREALIHEGNPVEKPVRSQPQAGARGAFRHVGTTRAMSIAAAPGLVIDARGLNCPLPLLKLKKALALRAEVRVFELLATDEDSVADVERHAARSGLLFECARRDDGVLALRVTRT